MVVDKLGTEKFSVNFCLLFVHGSLQRQSRMRVLAHAVSSDWNTIGTQSLAVVSSC